MNLSYNMRSLTFCFLASLLIFGSSIQSADKEYVKKRVLIGSPVRQKLPILKEFLKSINSLDKSICAIDCYFVDDNEDPQSSQELAFFADDNPNSKLIIEKSDHPVESYVCNEVTHYWKHSLIWKVASFKNKIIDYARDNDYDYLFLIDSDMVLHPKTLNQLISNNKDIVSNIFWTEWSPNTMPAPQVWLYDFYTQHEHEQGESLSQEEAYKRTIDFYSKLRKPGVYEVGGLCACTLINQHALKTGVSFNRIKNLTYWGEDRHFCIRAVALGLSLFVDTHYPAFHIYRDSDLEGVSKYIRDNNAL